MEVEKTAEVEFEAYDYGDETKSTMGLGGQKKPTPAEYSEGDEVQMEVPVEKGKTFVHFVIRGEPHRNISKRHWEYQLNYKKGGAQYEGDKYFPESDLEPLE